MTTHNVKSFEKISEKIIGGIDTAIRRDDEMITTGMETQPRHHVIWQHLAIQKPAIAIMGQLRQLGRWGH